MEKQLPPIMPMVHIQSHTDLSPETFRDRKAAWLLVCREGQAECHRGSHTIPLAAGDILLLPPGNTLGTVTPQPDTKTYRHIAIYISAQALHTIEELEGHTIPQEVVQQGFHLLHTTGTQWEYLTILADNIHYEAQLRQFGWVTVLYGRVFSFMGLLTRTLQAKYDSSYGQSDLLNQLLQYVEYNLGQKITLADTAHRFLISESYISKLFRSHMDTSFYRYVIGRRLLAAQRLIAAGVPLEQIGSQVGFCDHAAFYRAFKQEYGQSPRQYKATHTPGNQDEL